MNMCRPRCKANNDSILFYKKAKNISQLFSWIISICFYIAKNRDNQAFNSFSYPYIHIYVCRMTSSALIPTSDNKNYFRQSSSTYQYSIHDHGQGYRTYSFELNLKKYEPEQINVLIDKSGKLRIHAKRSVCHRFRRSYYLGGPSIEARLIRNTIDMHGRLRVDVEVRPRQHDSLSINHDKNHDRILTFDLRGYRPKNVTVRVDDNGLLKVYAQHNDDTTEHGVSKEYYRQYQLPKTINPDHIRARLDENQILTIRLPSSSLRRSPSWEPYYENNDRLANGKRPYGKPCCCCCWNVT